MKSSILALPFTVAALVGLPPTSTAAMATDLELFQKALAKRIVTEELKSGVCVCSGGTMNGETGVIASVSDEDNGNIVVLVACLGTQFDDATGEVSDTELCDEGWTPLPK